VRTTTPPAGGTRALASSTCTLTIIACSQAESLGSTADGPMLGTYLTVLERDTRPKDYERIFRSAFAAKFSVLR
jgi:hypothetical protein